MSFFSSIENLLYDVSRLFLAPVMLLIAAALTYALVMLGGFAVEAWQRRKSTHPRELLVHAQSQGSEVVGDDLELWILQRLEWLRIVSRTAPMLGLIATMIPMGPALLALGGGNAAEVGRNMVAAFSAVILALLAASICFFILTIRRRWLLQDLRELERGRQAAGAA
ncbi:MotA/TolQ/ExbB proton channel family protein [Pollutimonas thiosulfatoxidans]|uniref:Biopolymer transporter ExbD n=1 Tax=Pollutimonas thiosulfatoxidans TaxID=2028345 RepID=A0A410GDU3_9BURK|nr:MotA/TolQ/ExbB proton channel family protein [Pollutimonas thiosulfatoxidans]QAA94463.1 biopolymer transporter ExbD [Pollutimonas thiosulfatoxidans]